MTIGIEYICTGNNGRSPMAEAIAKDYIRREELVDQFEISSSGSGLSEITRKTGEALNEQRLNIIKMGLEGGVYRSGSFNSIAEEVLEAGMEAVNNLVKMCVDYLVKAEAIFRDMALLDVG